MSRFIRKNPYQKVPAIPPFLRNHLWQPLKALLASLELWLLIPITLHSPDGVRSMFTVAYGTWADGMILAVQLIFLYILTHFFDSVDDITFVDYCKSPVSLLRRYSWWLSVGLCTVGCAPSLAVGDQSGSAEHGGGEGSGTALHAVCLPACRTGRMRHPAVPDMAAESEMEPSAAGGGRLHLLAETANPHLSGNRPASFAVPVRAAASEDRLPVHYPESHLGSARAGQAGACRTADPAGGSQLMPADCRHTSALCVAQAETAPRSVGRAGTQRTSELSPRGAPLPVAFVAAVPVRAVRRRHTREPLARRHCLLPAQVAVGGRL